MAKGLNRKERKRGCNVPVQPTVPKMPRKHLEKKIRRYVIASPDSGQYLIKKPGRPIYNFTNNIIRATKCESELDAKFVIQCYYIDTHDNYDLVAIPLDITYELINEIIDEDLTVEEYWEDLNKWKKLN